MIEDTVSGRIKDVLTSVEVTSFMFHLLHPRKGYFHDDYFNGNRWGVRNYSDTSWEVFKNIFRPFSCGIVMHPRDPAAETGASRRMLRGLWHVQVDHRHGSAVWAGLWHFWSTLLYRRTRWSQDQHNTGCGTCQPHRHRIQSRRMHRLLCNLSS